MPITLGVFSIPPLYGSGHLPFNTYALCIKFKTHDREIYDLTGEDLTFNTF